MKETQMDRREEIWSALDGRRIILAGLKNDQRQMYQENLVYSSRQKHIRLTVEEKAEHIGSEDLVLVFGQVSGPEQGKKASDGTGANEELKCLLETMKLLAGRKPAASVLVTDCQVYGAMFASGDTGEAVQTGSADSGNGGNAAMQIDSADSGKAAVQAEGTGPEDGKKQRSVTEAELGYISHTSKTEVSLQYMRMAEYLACRLAEEEQLHIRVARQNLRPETEALEQMMEALIRVLLYGKDGEIYNLPASGREFVFEGGEEASPLSPLELALDTEKIEGLISD